MIGDVIGNFRLLSKLGKGGMGEVFLGEHTSQGTKVAIKLLHADISKDTEQVARFFNEAKIVSRIKHAGTVKIFDSGFHSDNAYLIMELLEGQSLSTRLDKYGRMSAPQIADIGRQIASILDATHRSGVTHRDLKPDNIFLVADEELASGERVKILDFGIAKLSSGTLAGSGPKTQGTMGTPTYMAPEQWGDSANVDWRADVYSLGCVAFEMACGKPPFIAHNIAEAYAKHLNDKPPSVRERAPELPAELEALIHRLLAKKPEDRPQSMAEIGRLFAAGGDGQTSALAETLGKIPASSFGMPIATSSTTLGGSIGQITPPPMTRPRRRVGLMVLVGAAAACAIGATVLVVTRSSSGTNAPVASHEPSSPPPPPPPSVGSAVVKDPPPVQPPPSPPVVVTGSGSGSGSGLGLVPKHDPPKHDPPKHDPPKHDPPKALDSDGDGVPDTEDRCPRDAGPARTRGCPDRDGDGIADMDDACPTVPGLADRQGCPAPATPPPPPPPPPPGTGSGSALDGRT